MNIKSQAKFPDFIYIGAGKCGTTSLFNYVKQHPDIYLCPKKETFYFINEEARKKLLPWGAVTTLSEYFELFEAAPKGSTIGEFSTNYYAYPESAALIYNARSDVKLIAFLRNPADRAFSSYQMHVRQGGEKETFSNHLCPESKYVKRGFYYTELLPFFEKFSHDQIKVWLYEDFSKSPQKVLKEVFTFIQVDNTFLPDMSFRGRVGGIPKNKFLHNLLNQQNSLRSAAATLLKPLMPLQQRQAIRAKLSQRNIQKVKINPVDREKLIQLYQEDILRLQDLLKRDLSLWLS